MALHDDIRDWVLSHGRSQRSAAKHFGVSRDTVAALLRKLAEAGQHKNVLLLCPSGVGKTHLLLGSAAPPVRVPVPRPHRCHLGE